VLAAEASTARAGKGPAFRYILVGHIGSKGTGLGQFSSNGGQGPGGVAVDQVCGDVYISDRGRKVIHHYDQNGNPIDEIGSPGTGRGQLDQPMGLFVRNPVVQPLNPLGPPSRCNGDGFLWVADYGDHRIAVFDPAGTLGLGKGQVQAMWCNTSLKLSGCDIVRGDQTGFDYNPNDVWAVGDTVWVAGRLSNSIRQYTLSGNFVRSTSTTNNAAYSVAAWGINLWSTYGGNGSSTVALYALDASSPTISLVHAFPWSLGGPFEDTRGLATGIDGTLYVVDRAGLQVFSPNGTLLSTTAMPSDFIANDVAVRYDGTVYVTGENGYGANVYSPGPLVTLSRRSFSRDEIVLAGGVSPSRAHDRIILQRLEANGWHTLVTLRLDGRSRFVYHWRPPRRLVHYRVRAFFPDPHPYYSDRESQILVVSTS
jgi:hypothetical protein